MVYPYPCDLLYFIKGQFDCGIAVLLNKLPQWIIFTHSVHMYVMADSPSFYLKHPSVFCRRTLLSGLCLTPSKTLDLLKI